MNEEVPVWWWPAATFCAGIPVFTVLGIVGFSTASNPQIIPLESIYRARYLKDELERRGFTAGIYEYPEKRTIAIDFYDPTLEAKLIEVGSFLDKKIVETYVKHIGRGSIAFQDGKTEGDVPVIALRPPEVKGWWRETLTPPQKIKITNVHVHTWNSLPATHLHVKGEDLYAEDLEKLAEFISSARNATRMFTKPVRK